MGRLGVICLTNKLGITSLSQPLRLFVQYILNPSCDDKEEHKNCRRRDFSKYFSIVVHNILWNSIDYFSIQWHQHYHTVTRGEERM